MVHHRSNHHLALNTPLTLLCTGIKFLITDVVLWLWFVMHLWLQHDMRCSSLVEGRRKGMFYLTMHSTHFIYGYMASDHTYSERKPAATTWATFRLAARVLLYASSHRKDDTYHGLCYTSRGALAGTRNSSMGPPHEGSIRRLIALYRYKDFGYNLSCILNLYYKQK